MRYLVPFLSLFFYHASTNADVMPTTTDFSKPEVGEALPGGEATYRKKRDKHAFSHPSANMAFEHRMAFNLGKSIFEKIWVSSPASTKASDGLGPLFNARSCQRCHVNNGRGHVPEQDWPLDTAVSMFLRLSIPAQNAQQQAALNSGKISAIPEPTYGNQLQDFAVTGLVAEGHLKVRYQERLIALSDGEVTSLRVPRYTIADLGYGDLHPQTMISPRIAPPMIGLGLLEAISEEDLLSLEDPDDRNNDGVSGRANRVWDVASQSVQIGRFGWKAGNPNLNQQNSTAFAGDIGLSNALIPKENGDCTANQRACLGAPHGNSPHLENLEVSSEMSAMVAFYTQNIAVPHRRNVSDPRVLAGKSVFYKTGCVQCHVPSYKTAQNDRLSTLSGQVIWPYTDLLLHDMGPGLADNRPEYQASGSEWRTPPLWGIGLTQRISGKAQYLHDGRARNLLEAVLWHGGEAEAMKQAVQKMPKRDRDNLIYFLESL